MTQRAKARIIPCEITVEVTDPVGSRKRQQFRAASRHGETIRIAVTYRLEEPQGAALEEEELASLIRRSVASTLRTYRLARLRPRRRGDGASTTEIELADATEEGEETRSPAGRGIEQEEIVPRKRTQAQQRTLEIMAHQLNLEGHALSDLLGLRCNHQRLDDLTYREAAALIAYWSGLLRQRLQKERDAKAGKPKYKENKEFQR